MISPPVMEFLSGKIFLPREKSHLQTKQQDVSTSVPASQEMQARWRPTSRKETCSLWTPKFLKSYTSLISKNSLRLSLVVVLLNKISVMTYGQLRSGQAKRALFRRKTAFNSRRLFCWDSFLSRISTKDMTKLRMPRFGSPPAMIFPRFPPFKHAKSLDRRWTAPRSWSSSSRSSPWSPTSCRWSSCAPKACARRINPIWGEPGTATRTSFSRWVGYIFWMYLWTWYHLRLLLLFVTLGKQKKETNVISKNMNPFFNEKFSLRAVDTQLPLEVTVWDKDTLTSNFLGRTVITLRSIMDVDPIPKKYVLFFQAKVPRLFTCLALARQVWTNRPIRQQRFEIQRLCYPHLEMAA